MFYVINPVTDRYTSGGFSTREEAAEYIRTTRPNGLLVEDRRGSPEPQAVSILSSVWERGQTLTSDQYATLAQLAGLSDTPAEAHPSALWTCLGLAGQFSAWEDSGKLQRIMTPPVSIP